MFGWFKKKPPEEGEANVRVLLNPLVILLAGRERQKGSPLTEEEVLAIRDNAQCVMMTADQAERFYESLDQQFPVPRIDPERCWEEWQEIREHLEY